MKGSVWEFIRKGMTTWVEEVGDATDIRRETERTTEGVESR